MPWSECSRAPTGTARHAPTLKFNRRVDRSNLLLASQIDSASCKFIASSNAESNRGPHMLHSEQQAKKRKIIFFQSQRTRVRAGAWSRRSETWWQSQHTCLQSTHAGLMRVSRRFASAQRKRSKTKNLFSCEKQRSNGSVGDVRHSSTTQRDAMLAPHTCPSICRTGATNQT